MVKTRLTSDELTAHLFAQFPYILYGELKWNPKSAPAAAKLLIPCPQVKTQTYCSAPACQRERRQLWQRKKFRDDPFYRENLQDAQRAWRNRNPDYLRNYRATNPEYSRWCAPAHHI